MGEKHRQIIVAFSGRTDLWWLRFLKKGFRHCFVCIDDGERWVALDPLAHRMEIGILPMSSDFDLKEWLEGQGFTVAAAQVDREATKPAPVMPYSCVEAIKRVLGIRARSVVTPWGLYRFLKENEKQFLREMEGQRGKMRAVENPEKNKDGGDLVPKDVPGPQGVLSAPDNPGIDAFLAELKKPLDPEDEFLIKPVEQISKGEIKGVMAGEAYHNAQDTRRSELLDKAGAWHDHFYGTGPVKRDATGRQISPRPVRVMPKEDMPVGDAKGGNVAKGVFEIGSRVAEMAGRGGIADAIRALQSGLNKMPRREGTIFSTVPLREDGLFGPKTKQRLYQSVGGFGPRRIGAEISPGSFFHTP